MYITYFFYSVVFYFGFVKGKQLNTDAKLWQGEKIKASK